MDLFFIIFYQLSKMLKTFNTNSRRNMIHKMFDLRKINLVCILICKVTKNHRTKIYIGITKHRYQKSFYVTLIGCFFAYSINSNSLQHSSIISISKIIVNVTSINKSFGVHNRSNRKELFNIFFSVFMSGQKNQKTRCTL